MSAAQRMEMVRRVADEIDFYILELGTNGRQVRLQREELLGDNEVMRELLVRDYYASPEPPTDAELRKALGAIEDLSDADLLDLSLLGRCFGYPTTVEALDTTMTPARLPAVGADPRLQFAHIERLVARFDRCRRCWRPALPICRGVEGIGNIWARHIREGLSRLAETSLDRF